MCVSQNHLGFAGITSAAKCRVETFRAANECIGAMLTKHKQTVKEAGTIFPRVLELKQDCIPVSGLHVSLDTVRVLQQPDEALQRNNIAWKNPENRQ